MRIQLEFREIRPTKAKRPKLGPFQQAKCINFPMTYSTC